MRKLTGIIYLLLLHAILLAIPASFAETGEVSEEEGQARLEDLRSRIKDVENRIQGARTESEKMRKELRENEVTSAQTLTRLHDIRAQITQKDNELETLQFEQKEHEQALQAERKELVGQIRAAYQIGRNDYIKLLLNQEDPARVGRALAYYDYHNRIRAQKINLVQQSLQEINSIEQSIRKETQQLDALRLRHEDKLGEFHRYRASRRDIIERLQANIEEQDIELHTLQENERELGSLLSELKQEQAVTIEVYEDMPPFDTLRGALAWPVNGKLLKRFGNRKKGGNLRWQGVLIDAESGTEVAAISTGKVVFADWFRNLGLLMIIDHGDGYMSLYGHNQNLLKNTGDWVLAGETIATVGDSGGQADTALYFEIRKGAEPLNPALWCQG